MRAVLPDNGLSTFRKEMDRFLDRFWDGGEMPPMGAWAPDLDILEAKEALTIRAEVPGIDPKDIQVTLENGVLMLRGEKRQEMEQKDERVYRSERHYGSFARSVRLPATVDATKVLARFKNGVLTVVLPKTAEAKGRAIPIAID